MADESIILTGKMRFPSDREMLKEELQELLERYFENGRMSEERGGYTWT